MTRFIIQNLLYSDDGNCVVKEHVKIIKDFSISISNPQHLFCTITLYITRYVGVIYEILFLCPIYVHFLLRLQEFTEFIVK